MSNKTITTVATDAASAKVITDNYLSTLTPEQCFSILKQHLSGELPNRTVHNMGISIAYEIGAGSFYYGKECKEFPSQVIDSYICKHGTAYAAELADSKV